MRKLPLCQDKRLKKCIDNQIGDAQSKILEKPCTKLQYKIFKSSWEGSDENMIKVNLFMAKPNKVTNLNCLR